MGTTIQTLSAYSDALTTAVAAAGESVVAVNGRQRIPSSGVLWRPGIVVTAEHSLKRDDEITVTLPDNREVAAALAGRDPGTDLAVLKIEDAVFRANFANATALLPGNLVFALGRRGQNGLSASMGVVSAVSGPWRTWRGGPIERFVRPDVNLYPGMSGGALIDSSGGILGINTSALTRGTGVTVPAETVDRVCDELLKRGKIARGYFGVGLHPVDLPQFGGGVIVLSVEPSGAAAKAGILVGDVFIRIGATPVRNTDEVQAHLTGETVGQPLTVTLVRGGAAMDLQVVPGER